MNANVTAAERPVSAERLVQDPNYLVAIHMAIPYATGCLFCLCFIAFCLGWRLYTTLLMYYKEPFSFKLSLEIPPSYITCPVKDGLSYGPIFSPCISQWETLGLWMDIASIPPCLKSVVKYFSQNIHANQQFSIPISNGGWAATTPI